MDVDYIDDAMDVDYIDDAMDVDYIDDAMDVDYIDDAMDIEETVSATIDCSVDMDFAYYKIISFGVNDSIIWW